MSVNAERSQKNGYVIGFIGCGEIAHLHAECLQRLGARIAGGYDLSMETAARFVRSFGGEIFDSAQALCGSEEIDAVYICTRHDSHVAYIEVSANAGKAVFCEKPLALDLRSASVAAEIVERSGIPFALGFNHRYSPGADRLKRFLDGFERGFDVLNVQFVTAPFLGGWAGLKEQGGGILVCLGSHVFDLIHYLAPGEIKVVHSVTKRQRLPAPFLEDTFAAILTTESGQLITVNAHDHGNARYSTDPGNRLNTIHAFVGEEAAIAGTSRFEWHGKVGSVIERYATDILTAWGYEEINRRFLRVLAGDPADVPGIEAGLFAARMVEACGVNRQ